MFIILFMLYMGGNRRRRSRDKDGERDEASGSMNGKADAGCLGARSWLGIMYGSNKG